MMQEINLVQGFRGKIQYLLNCDGRDIDISNATSILFNFADRHETNQHSIRCENGDLPNEAVIPFLQNELQTFGEFFGEFVIRDGSDISIYPITDRIRIHIRKRIQA
jgi:hypothetical protein